MDSIMTMDKAILWIRNTVVSMMAAKLGIPIALSDEQDPKVPPSYGYYSFVTPYAPTGELGSHTRMVIVDPETQQRFIQDVRAEYPEMVLSFSFCSSNRILEVETETIGENEAMSLAMGGAAWLLQEGRAALSLLGIVVLRVSNAASRSGLFADEYIRRWGFDVTIRYKAITIRRDDIIEKIITIREESQWH